MAGYGLHIIQFPTNRYGYVGTIPCALGSEVAATPSDVMGCRSYTDEHGAQVVCKFPSFATYAQAEAHAINHGYEPRKP